MTTITGQSPCTGRMGQSIMSDLYCSLSACESDILCNPIGCQKKKPNKKNLFHRKVDLTTGYKCRTHGNFKDFPLLSFADF